LSTTVAPNKGAPLGEAAVAAMSAAMLALLLVRYGPPGTDMAAHVYQRTVFLQHGFALWNNLWYSGRYSFVTYSLAYYPLAGLVGIRILAVATVAIATIAFSALVWRQWGDDARWAPRTFALAWAAVVLSGAFPFMLGVAFALLALCALQAHARWPFAALVALTAAASPVAFLLLGVVVAGCGLARARWRGLASPAAVVGLAASVELVLWRMFPSGGRYPFSAEEFLAATAFCALGWLMTWRVERLRILRLVFPVYFAACLSALVVPSGLGENICRLRYLAIPVAVLALSLRRWKPVWLAAPALALAVAWNTTPLIASYVDARRDPSASAAYWQPAIGFLHAHLAPSYRVEAVDTAGHWDAVYLPEAGIPLVRGWFRQDDFPQNTLLYRRPTARQYRRWLRGLGVRYVVLTGAPPDYSARSEAALLAGGDSGLRVAYRGSTTTVFAVPNPRAIATGPGHPRIVAMTETHVRVRLTRPGRFRLAVRYSPYWKAAGACVEQRPDGMTELISQRAGTVSLGFDVTIRRAIAALGGASAQTCATT